MAYTVTEAEKSQELQSASWRPRRVHELAAPESEGVRNRRADDVVLVQKPTG